MLKKILKVAVFFLIVVLSSKGVAFSSTNNALSLTGEEKQWITNNKNRVLTLGIDPYSGNEYFKNNGEEKGYLISFIKIVNENLGLNIKLEASKSWGEVYSGLQDGSVDILFGANRTPEREKFMNFTMPISKVPYALIAKKDGNIYTIGDIDKRPIGFLNGDIVMELLPKSYKNIKYDKKIYNSETDLISALGNNEIDAFIVSGGDVVYSYIYDFPDLKYAFKIDKITSERTFSTRKEDKILSEILDKQVTNLLDGTLPELMNQSKIEYNMKVMNLTESERNWIKNNGQAIMGITKDYLPFDYYKNGVYAGISGEIIKEISSKTGIKFKYVYDEFDVLMQKLMSGEINVLNIAKTDERLKYILYPKPYSTERDIIVGRVGSKDAIDVFGLEGKKVAVIKGFWHEEYLRKNLTNVDIIETNSIKEALSLVHSGKADYLIENPSVIRFYVENMQLFDIVQKGTTSTDSYLYYGVSKNTPELASIIDKVIPLMEIDELFNAGYSTVPHEKNNQANKRFILIILGLAALILIIVLFAVKIFRDLIREKTKTSILKEKEHLLYTDALTGVYNRNYYNDKVKDKIDKLQYPQTIIVSDVNDLKKVNDNYGHIIGDELLKCFANALKETFPECNLILRMGGDEFHLILQNTTEEQMEDKLKEIKKVLLEKSLAAGEGKKIPLNAAFGYATRRCSKESIDFITVIADRRMYEDKNKTKREKAKE